MPRSPWEIVLWVLVVVFPGCWCALKRRRDLAFLAVMWGILCASAQVLANPAGERHEAVIACGVLLALDLGAWLLPEALEIKILKLARSKAAKLLIVSLGLSLVPAAIVERGCRLLTDWHVLKYHQAIQTVWRAGHDDWRLATITGDENREPDPVLLWRPVPHSPFNAQRFKGPLAEIPKPADVYRVMCYGDSLTDGPPRGGWPSWLNRLLQEQGPRRQGADSRSSNAGVAGYSSHQGLLRFLQEVDRYQPDHVLVSFGWNDAAEAIGTARQDVRDSTLARGRWPSGHWCAIVLILCSCITRKSGGPSRRRPPAAGLTSASASKTTWRTWSDSGPRPSRRGISIAFSDPAAQAPPAELSQNPNLARARCRSTTQRSAPGARQNVPVTRRSEGPSAAFPRACSPTSAISRAGLRADGPAGAGEQLLDGDSPLGRTVRTQAQKAKAVADRRGPVARTMRSVVRSHAGDVRVTARSRSTAVNGPRKASRFRRRAPAIRASHAGPDRCSSRETRSRI